ncbi:MAG: DUF3638 domain-containing protein [Legionellales bacterium]|nr:DUF3638 domain-containing protein [Legionellales bacterium]
MRDISEFLYCTLNSRAGLDCDLVTSFKTALQQFDAYVKRSEYSNIASSWQGLLRDDTRSTPTKIAQDIQALPVGEVYMLHNTGTDFSRSWFYIYRFKKVSEGVLSLSLYCSDKGDRDDELALTCLHSSENTYAMQRVIHLNAGIDNQELFLLVRNLLDQKNKYNRASDLKKSLPFLQSDIIGGAEEHSPLLLQGQSYFARAMYRLLYDHVPDKMVLEQCLLRFVRHTILDRQDIAQNNADVYKRAVTDHTAYYQYTSCIEEAEKQHGIALLQERLSALTLGQTFRISASSGTPALLRPDASTLDFTPVTRRPRPIAEINRPLVVPFIEPVPHSTLLSAAQQFCRTLSEQAEQDVVGRRISIESFLLRCPFPTEAGYQGMRLNDWQELGQAFEVIGQEYLKSLREQLGGRQTPKSLVTVCSMIYFRNYCHEREKTNYSIFPLVQELLADFLSTMQLLPHISTYHPEFDRRWRVLTRHCTMSSPYDSFSFRRRVINVYTELLKSSSNYAAIEQATQRANGRLPEKRDHKSPLEYYFASACAKNTFPDADRKFTQALKLELFLTQCFSALRCSSSRAENFSNDYGMKSPFLSLGDSSWIQANLLANPAFITSSKESCQPQSLVTIALRKKYMNAEVAVKSYSYNRAEPYSSHTVQIASHHGEKERRMTPEDIVLRQMLQFDLADNPKPLVLSHYSGKIGELSDRDLQYYVLEQLLHGQSFLAFLEQPELFEQYLNEFDVFIEKGFKRFENHAQQLTQTSLSFVQLALYVNTYIAQDKHSDTDGRLGGFLQRLNEWIRTHRNDPTLSASLHQYRLSLILTLKQFSSSHTDYFSEAFISYGYLKIQSNLERPDTFVEKIEREEVSYQFQTWLYQSFNQNVTPDLIRRLAKQIDLPIMAEDTIEIGNLHQIVVQRAGVDIFYFDLSLSVFVNAEGLTYSSIPEVLRNHAILPYLNKTPAYCFCNATHTIFLLANDPDDTRIELDASQQVSVYQQRNLSGEKKCYSLIPLGNILPNNIRFRARKLGFTTGDLWSHYDGSYFSAEMRCWLSEERIAYIMHHDDVIYTVSVDGLRYHAPGQPATGLMHYVSDANKLRAFETPNYCHTHLDPGTLTGHIQFLRCPELIVQVEESQYYLMHQGERYEQILQGKVPFTPLGKVSHFLFSQVGHPEVGIALLAVRAFTEEREGVRDNTIGRETSLKTLTYHFNPATARLSTNHASDALYLAYVYAATYDYDQAIATLNDLNLIDLNNNQEEIQYLNWLVGLPLGEEIRLYACQLKAFSLYTRCVNEKQSGTVSFKGQILPRLPKIAQCYQFYIENRAYLPSIYLLNEMEINSLESFFVSQSTPLRSKKVTNRGRDERTITVSPYSSLPEAFQANLLHKPNGNQSEAEALKHLNSDISSEMFAKYFACYVQMTQSADPKIKARMLGFCKNYLQYSCYSEWATTLYRLCHQTVALDRTLSVRTLRTEIPSFTAIVLKQTKIELQLDKPVRAREYALDLLSLPRTLEPTTTMGLFIRAHYFDFYQAYLALDLAHKDAVSADMTEEVFGETKLHYLSLKLALIERVFTEVSARERLLSTLTVERDTLDKARDVHWEQALTQAHAALWENKYYLIRAGHYLLPTQQDLMRCYAGATADRYTDMTLLTDVSAIQSLHEMIHQAMITTLRYQQFKRLTDELSSGIKDERSETIRWGKLLDLMFREHDPALQNRADLIHLEVTKDIMIRPEQAQMAKTIMEKSCVIDATMGSGKTSVVIPMVTAQIPNNTIKVIIVLRSLLKTTHSYLHTLCANTNQIPYLFDFHRNHDISVQAVQSKRQLLQHLAFNNPSEKKHFMVSTADSMQSLGMKYIELTWVTQYKKFEEQISMLQEMLMMMLLNGEFLIDEFHEVQDDYKSPIRYAYDKPMPISQELIQDVVGLYKFREEHPCRTVSEFIWNLLNHSHSPMNVRLRQCMKSNLQFSDKDIKDAITDFWLNDSRLHFEKSPRFRKYLETVQTQLRLFEHMQHVHHEEHFGPSKDESLSALERCLAIPYFSNKKPKEGSHYEDPQENISYTIESCFHAFPLPLIRELIDKWQLQAGVEFQNSSDEFHSFSETATAVRFRTYFDRDLDPSVFKKDDDTLRALQGVIQHNSETLYEILEFDILPKILVDSTVLESRAFDHLFSYRTGSGMTGTPDAANASLPIDNSASRGAREFYAALLRKHETPVRHLDYTDVDTFLNTLYDQYPEPQKLRALIDIGGRLKDENIDIAKGFARLLLQKRSPVKYVLYYDVSDELCAIPTWDCQKSIPLGRSTDPKTICTKLNGCSTEELAIVYDQSHTEGADLVNAVDCDGATILNKETTFDKFMQGAMRLRDLAEKQRITVILPKCLVEIQTIQQVIEHTRAQAQLALPKRKLSTAAGEMTSIVRRNLLTRMLQLNTAEAQHDFIRQPEVQAFFITSRLAYLEEEDELDIHLQDKPPLEAHAQDLIQRWRPVVERLPDAADDAVASKVSDVLRRPEAYDHRISQLFGASLETQTQVQIQVEAPDLGVHFNSKLRAQKIKEWSARGLLSFSRLLPVSAGDIASDFSPDLWVSPNFVQIYDGQTELLIHPFMKPVDVVLFSMSSPEHITACLITTEEAHAPALIRQIQTSGTDWLSTTNHMVIRGRAPKDIQDNMAYQILIEQIRFFAGKFNELVDQKTPYAWLSEESKRKFDFYENFLKSWRETDATNFEKLKANFSRQMIVFKEMSKHPFRDYTQEDFVWEDVNPDVTPADITLFQTLGRAYLQMNRAYYDYDFRSNTPYQLAQRLKKSLKVPALILGHVMQHLKRLADFKAALLTVVEPYDTDYLMRLTGLEKEVSACIEEILGIAIPQLLKQYDYDCDENQFPSEERKNQFELDVLGCFLASKAFPEGAKNAFIRPIQDKLDGLREAEQIALFSCDSFTEYKVRYLLQSLTLQPGVLLALAQRVQEPETIMVILSRCQGDPAVFQKCLERFATDQAILEVATNLAVAPETFTHLVGIAEGQGRLFTEEWLDRLFANQHLPISIVIGILQRVDINDAFLNRAAQDARVIERWIQEPMLLIQVLNAVTRSKILSAGLKQEVIAQWVNQSADSYSEGELTQQYHDFYAVLFAAMLTEEGDRALASVFVMAQAHTFPVFEALVEAMLTCAYNGGAIASSTPKKCMRLNGVTYQMLLDNYVYADSERLLRVLLEHSTCDNHLQQLMASNHLEAWVAELLVRAKNLAWLIDHEKATDTIWQSIIRDPRFTAQLALRMIQRDLSQDTMQVLLLSTACTVDVSIAILNNPNHHAYYSQIIESLIAKLPIVSAQLLRLIQHASCSEESQLERIIPHGTQFAHKQALAAKITTAKCAKQLMVAAAGDASVAQRLDINLVTQDFGDVLLGQMLTSAECIPDFFAILRTYLLKRHEQLGFHSSLALFNYARNLPTDFNELVAKIAGQKSDRSSVSIFYPLVQTGVTLSAIESIIQEPRVEDAGVFDLIYQKYAANTEVCCALRNKGILNAQAISFVTFQQLLNDHEFERADLGARLASHPFEQADLNEPAIQSLQNAAKQLHAKSCAFLNPKKDPYNNAAQASAALYFCLRHQLLQFEKNVISKEQLAHNMGPILGRYKGILSQHRGYRQICYDIAQAILCLLGVGLVMTAYKYATTGSCRLFIWKNEAQRIVEDMEQTIQLR